ncbi:heavy metal translocating P-type ATPase [Salipiger sp. PrR002]|uniref:heavy metal translocating P-type ATPase n=1 Tax=Salipiger sp. PrR002 TaxID=2706489 RepID=UPI0013B84BA5|nr:heavy metal translocating P-type ATPase [Salipiger sp. PrR002]NDW01554.1 cadmium-translocating P-type ATPase [Salipiger sp. PrR002]NDW58211.1 cadmium-translocating P-type ATPase [Salipiger sp. PrR004]
MTTTTEETLEWRVTGMDCGSCAAKVRGAVERFPGASGVEVALMTERLRLHLDETQTSRTEIESAVRGLGFGIAAKGQPTERPKGAFVLPDDAIIPLASAPEDAAAEDATVEESGWHQTTKGRMLIGTGGLLAVAWGIELLAGGGLAHWAFVIATLLGAAPIARRAFKMALAGMPFTIEMLMSIAAVGALFIGAAGEAAVVVFLFALGEVLEGVAAGKARQGIRSLASLVPKTARVMVGSQPREIAAAHLQVGQVVQVRPGDRVPADGTVIAGRSSVDESPVTGESVPAPKDIGAEVFAGSINAEAELRVRVSRAAEDNTIARIVRLVEEAESARAPTERFIERFSRWYMPAVVGAALLVAVLPPLVGGAEWSTWIYRGLALLLIGCPCALVISVPASIASALSTGARHGLLLKGGAVVEAAAQTSLVVFDKTGTLTEGRPQVTDLCAVSDDESELLRLAAAVEHGSSHPLARAIIARAEGLDIPPAQDAGVLAGQGAFAMVGGLRVTVGAPRLAEAAGLLPPNVARQLAGLEEAGKTVVTVFTTDRLLGLIALRDEPRADAAKAVASLAEMGIASTMLTGDNARTAAAIGAQIGIAHQAGLLPQDKVTALQALAKGRRVMMIGDGINDAPALAVADVGLAMGSGTDVALETADGALLRDRVADVPGLLRLSRATMRNIRQNVALALGLKGVFLVTTILGVTGLWVAILADTGATVLVTLNALRLLGFRPSSH